MFFFPGTGRIGLRCGVIVCGCGDGMLGDGETRSGTAIEVQESQHLLREKVNFKKTSRGFKESAVVLTHSLSRWLRGATSDAGSRARKFAPRFAPPTNCGIPRSTSTTVRLAT